MPTNYAGAEPAADVDGDLAACRTLLRNGSRTFLAASYLLPRRVRDAACALYAFCRIADDAVDEAGAQRSAVQRLRQRLDHLYAGQPEAIPYDRALARVVQQHAIPRPLFDALLQGFEWDASGRHYDTLAELQDYAARVAGTVGAMMALLMGVRSAEALARACDLGVAMQLSNIARDVSEDARAARLYLPRQWLRAAGVEPEAWLADPQPRPEIVALVRRLVREAEGLYQRVGAGVALLPADCRIGINAARYLYAGIGHEAARGGTQALRRRAVVPSRRKAWLLARALTSWRAPASAQGAPALPCTQFLIDAVVSADALRGAPAAPGNDAWRQRPTPRARVHGVLELFERLGRIDASRTTTWPMHSAR